MNLENSCFIVFNHLIAMDAYKYLIRWSRAVNAYGRSIRMVGSL